MTRYSTTQAQVNLELLLEEASRHGGVEIQRDDGKSFVIRPLSSDDNRSGLDVPPVRTKATTQDILAAVRDIREGRDRERT